MGDAICQKYDGVSISALRPESLDKFLMALEKRLRKGILPLRLSCDSDSMTIDSDIRLKREMARDDTTIKAWQLALLPQQGGTGTLGIYERISKSEIGLISSII